MGKKFIWFLLLIIEGCNDNNLNIKQRDIIATFEKGTDSTFKREHFINEDKSLSCTFTSYYNAQVASYIYYYDINRLKVREIETTMAQKKYGHFLQFYENGNLQTYYYNIDNGHSTRFIRKYAANGKLKSEEGTPFVDYIVDEDNAKANIFFSTIFFDSLDVNVSSVSRKSYNLSLKKSNMQPFLLEGEVSDSTLFFKIRVIEKKQKRQKYIMTL